MARGESFTCGHGKTFDPATDSCADCDAADDGPDDDSPGEGELLCAEAKRRGLPDQFDVEERMWAAYAYSNARSHQCADRADAMYDTDVELAVKLEMAAAKWNDTAIKAAKLGAVNVSLRERMAREEAADRALDRAEAAH